MSGILNTSCDTNISNSTTADLENITIFLQFGKIRYLQKQVMDAANRIQNFFYPKRISGHVLSATF
jgi:hypothetical protein